MINQKVESQGTKVQIIILKLTLALHKFCLWMKIANQFSDKSLLFLIFNQYFIFDGLNKKKSIFALCSLLFIKPSK